MYGQDVELDDLSVDFKKVMKILESSVDLTCKQEEIWFDHEIRSLTGIDVFLFDFDVKKGYMIYEKNNYKLLLIRMEDLDSVFEYAMLDFFAKKINTVKSKNVGDQKIYKSTYKKVKNAVNYDNTMIKKMIDSRFFKQFYHDYETSVIERWGSRK